MKIIAGPGKTSITTPTKSVPKPKTVTVSLRQNENGRAVGSVPAGHLLRLLVGLLLDGFNVDTHIVDTLLRLQQAVLDLMGDGMPAVHAQTSIHCDMNVH
jgi:hypothetical protein